MGSTGSTSSRWPDVFRVLAWFWFVLLFLYVVVVSGNYTWMGSPIVRTVFHVLVAVLFAGWLATAALRADWRPDVRTAAAVGLPVLATAVATVASPIPRIAAENFATGLAWALIFLLATRLAAHPWFRTRLAGLLTLIVVVTVLAYLGQIAMAWVRWWQLTGVPSPPLRPESVSLTFGASPIVAGLVLILGPLAITRLQTVPMTRFLTVLGLIAGSIAIAITGSRAAYLGAAVAVLTVLALRLFGDRRAAGLGRRIGASPVLLALGGVVVVVLWVTLGSKLATRLFETSTVAERFDIWQSAITLFKSSPLVGTGPGTWPVLKYAANPPDSPNLVVPHAHSIPIQTASDLGILGLVLLGVFCAFLIRRSLRARRSEDPEVRALGWAAIVAMAGFAGLSLFEDFANLGTILFPLAALLGLVVGQTDGTTAVARWSARPVVRAGAFAVAVASMAIAIRFVGSSDDAALTADLGRQAADQGDWTRASQLFDQAFAADPDIPLYRMESSIGLALAGREGEAAERLAPAAAIEGSSISLLSLAWYQAAAGQTDASLASARLAWARGTGDPLVALNVGALAARGGAAELSVEAYGEAIYLAPALAASAYFTSLPIRDAVITKAMELVAAARSSGGSISRALILAYTGNLDEAQAELDRVPAGADRISVQATLDWLGGRRSEAINGLRTALDADPANGGIALQLAQLLAANGDPASARYFDWARLVGVGSVASTTVSGLGVTTAGEANDSGYPSNYPWMLYVRYGPLLLSAPDYLVVR